MAGQLLKIGHTLMCSPHLLLLKEVALGQLVLEVPPGSLKNSCLLQVATGIVRVFALG